MADQGGMSLPSAPPATPGLQANALFLAMDGFEGLNTKASRPAIKDQELSWCHNMVPLGNSNLRAQWGMGAALYIAPTALFISSFNFVNIGATPYAIVFLSNGAIYAINTTNRSQIGVAPPGTITNFSPKPFATQWGNQYVLICAMQTNGYWVWDGLNFYASGSLGPNVTLVNDGLDYTSQPTITAVGGSGSGATFTADLKNGIIDQITVVNPGSGYKLNDAVILAFTGGGSPGKTAIGIPVITNGSVSSVSVSNAGAGYTSAATGTILGGGGANATVSIVAAGGSVSSVSVTAGGQGYTSTPTLFIVDPNNPVAQAQAQLMPFGIQGSRMDSMTQHVFLINGSKVLFSATGSVSDFSTANGAGAFPSTDSFLRANFISILQSNGFLYLIGDSSVNSLSGIQTSGTPAITTFSNQNVDPQIGTPWPDSAVVYSRAVVFANSFGVHAVYGGAVQKVSGPLDGIYNTVPQTDWAVGFSPSSAVATIFGIHVYMLLLPVIDPISGLQQNFLMMWDGAKWFTGQQERPLVQIGTQEIDSNLTAWGCDGTGLYPMFQQPSLCLIKIVQSKLWDKPTYVMTKASVRIYLLVQLLTPPDNPRPEVDIRFQVDTDQGSNFLDTGVLSNVIWINNQSQVIPWVSN